MGTVSELSLANLSAISLPRIPPLSRCSVDNDTLQYCNKMVSETVLDLMVVAERARMFACCLRKY